MSDSSILDAAERSIEIDPRTADARKLDLLATEGFTRMSFGVQNFGVDVQEAIGRVQPPELVRDTLVAARDAGVRSINFDLIYGLPRQNVARFARTIDQVVDMRPESIHIGMDHFALPDDELAIAHGAGRLHRNFHGYSTQPDRDLVALGPRGGFFDRTLEHLRADREKPSAIGVGYSNARIPIIYPQPDDVPMDVVITATEQIGRSGSRVTARSLYP